MCLQKIEAQKSKNPDDKQSSGLVRWAVSRSGMAEVSFRRREAISLWQRRQGQ